MRHGSKRWLGILAGLVALATTPALAQDEAPADKPRHEGRHAGGERRGHDPEKKLEHLREALDLTDAQVVQARSIFAELGERRQALKQSEDREGMRALHEETHGRLMAILDETQRAKLEEMKARHGEGHRGNGEGRREGNGEGRGHGQHQGSGS
jgi:hypothetical protein